MITIKSFTDLSQSKKLSEILPLESADMMYHSVENEYGSGAFVATSKIITNGIENDNFYTDDISCWSLTALCHILPNTEHISTTLSRGGWKIEPPEYVDTWWCEYEDENDYTRNITVSADNPIDACYEMILKLNELNLL